MVKVNDKIKQTMAGLKLDMQHDPDFVFQKKKKKKKKKVKEYKENKYFHKYAKYLKKLKITKGFPPPNRIS